MLTSDFDYNLPVERIAQTPVEPRHASRLLVYNRATGSVSHRTFLDLIEYLNKGDLLVMNDTKVIPARIFTRKIPGMGKVELLLLEKKAENVWEALVGGSGMISGREVVTEDGLSGVVDGVLDGSRRLIRFSEPVEPHLGRIGHIPLPPYIHEQLQDNDRYQTIYARKAASAAAPTAGLHFTEELFARIREKGVRLAYVDLHVGLDTFAPVTEQRADEHQIHSEWCELPTVTAEMINQTRQNSGRVIAVGTTTVRTLESAAAGMEGNRILPFSGPTRLFILPGYQFKVVDAMITNFHLPKSTLLMLVSAFAGREQMLSAYSLAVQMHYRFFSFGDAMLIE